MSRPDLNRRAAEQCADAIQLTQLRAKVKELVAEVDRLTAENDELPEGVPTPLQTGVGTIRMGV